MTPITKLVKTQTKGMVTIPREFRQKLGIDENSLLEAKLVDNGVMFVKITYSSQNPQPELYSDAQISQFLKEDKLDGKTVKKLKKLLK